MVFTEVAAGVGMFKSLYDLIRDLMRSEDINEVRAGLTEINCRVIEAQAEIIRLQEENRALKAEKAENSTYEEQAQNYVLIKTPGGARVCVEKDGINGSADSTYFCPECYRNKKFSVLQPTYAGKQECPACKNEFPIDPPGGGVWEC